MKRLSDLKTGMHVILRDGDEYIVLKDTCLYNSNYDYDTYEKNIIKTLNSRTYTSLNNYNEDFTSAISNELDIVEVYTCNYITAILESVKNEPDSFTRIFEEKPTKIFEEKPTKKMTLEEIEKELGYKIEIVNG